MIDKNMTPAEKAIEMKDYAISFEKQIEDLDKITIGHIKQSKNILENILEQVEQ